MSNYYNDFHQYATVLTAYSHGEHTEHIAEFQQLVMLAIAGAKQEIKDEVLQEVELRYNLKDKSKQNVEVDVTFDEKGLISSIRNAIRRAFG